MSDVNIKDIVRVERHPANIDSKELNHSTDRVSNDNDFLAAAVNLLGGVQLPAFKQQIISFIKQATTNPDHIALYETLDGYIRYDDIDQIKAAFEVNVPSAKHQATPGRRDDVSIAETTPST